MITPFRIVILFFSVCLAAVLVIPLLRVDLVPQEKAPILQVNYSMANASPEIVEQQATAPLENVLSQINFLKRIESQSGYNQGRIQLEFDKQADMAMIKFEVASLIRQVYPQLPKSVSYPLIIQTSGKEKKEKSPLLIYTVTGPATSYEVKRKAEEFLQKPLALLPGVNDIQITGSENMQVSVVYDMVKMEVYRLSTDQLTAAIVAQTKSHFPGISQDKNGRELFLTIKGNGLSLNAIRDVQVSNHEGMVIRIKDVAKVFIEEEEANRFFRINNQNAINLSVYVREGENALVLRETIHKTLEHTLLNMPQGYQLRLEYDATEFLEKELNKNYLRTSLSVLILFIFIFISYRDWKYLLILVSALIVNVAFTILLTWYLDINIHLYTLAGIAISFGIMIDNAIVMLDYFHQFKNRKVFLALLGATLTTVVALLLVFLLPEEDRNNLTDFVSIIAVALGTSLLSSLLFIPGIYTLLFGKQISAVAARPRKKRWLIQSFIVYEKIILFLTQYRKSFLVVILLGFGLPVFLLPAKWDDHPWYNKTIGSDLYQETLRPFIDKSLGGSLRLFVRNVYEKSSYRDAERTKLYVTAQLPYGNTPDQMNYIIGRIEEYLETVEGIDKFVTNVYSGQYARIEISFLTEYETGSLPYWLKSRLIARSLDWSGVNWSVYGVGQGFSNGSQDEIPNFQVLMKGYNYDELEHQASLLSEKLLAHKRIQKVNMDERLSYSEKSSSEYVLQIDQQKLSLQQGSIYSLTNYLQQVSKPPYSAASIMLDNTLYPLSVREEKTSDFSTWELMQSSLRISPEKTIKLNNIATLDLQKTGSTIHKEDRQYIRLVGFEYYGSWQFGDKYLQEKLEEMKAEMPIGYSVLKQSWSWNFDQVKRQYSLLGILILANFIICAILFENLKQPLYIIATLPISFIGLFLIFAVFDFYFDQGGYAAFVLLGGLVVNASILVVNDFNNNFIGALQYNRRLLKTITNRSRTILLTVLSTCFGMIPFLIEGQSEVFWFSLAIGTIGGLVMSLVAVFVVLPVMMLRIDRTKNPTVLTTPLWS